MRRRAGLVLALLLVLPGLGAATVLVPPVTEQLVEGHTVFTVVESVRRSSTSGETFAAAVAVLVRDVELKATGSRFPGVLWFNDQYLTTPSSSSTRSAAIRYPCTGAILGVDAGAPDPRGTNFSAATYVESYRITDPNERAWDVDLWDTGANLLWTVAIMNNQAGYATPDNGTCNGSTASGNGCSGTIYMPFAGENESLDPIVDDGQRRQRCYGSGGGAATDNGYRYPCGGVDRPSCSAIRYNALLFFFLEDLHVPASPKNHTEGSADWMADVSGCHDTNIPSSYARAQNWPCPASDDDREGNSHPYHPTRAYPQTLYDGRYNHGGSADCDGDGFVDGPPNGRTYRGDYECHATRRIEIYYGTARPPITRRYAVLDSEGNTAPFHCHDDMTRCNQFDLYDSV